jgi:hypothetical protein
MSLVPPATISCYYYYYYYYYDYYLLLPPLVAHTNAPAETPRRPWLLFAVVTTRCC